MRTSKPLAPPVYILFGAFSFFSLLSVNMKSVYMQTGELLCHGKFINGPK